MASPKSPNFHNIVTIENLILFQCCRVFMQSVHLDLFSAENKSVVKKFKTFGQDKYPDFNNIWYTLAKF